MSSRAYVLRTLIIIISLLVILGLFNFSIDPYGMFESPKVEGRNKYKPEAWEWVGYKASAIKDHKPKIVILGTSRTEIGINPKHKVFAGQVAYNAAISGGDFSAVTKYFDYANKVASPKEIIIGLDFHTFNIHNIGTSDQGVDPFNANDSIYKVFNKVKVALSFRTLITSLATFGAQDTTILRWAPSDEGIINPESQEERILKNNYQESLFVHDEQEVPAREYLVPYSFYHATFNENDPINLFRHIIKEAYGKNIKLTFFISPAHARYWELIYRLGLWKQFNTWKRLLVTALNQEAQISKKSAFPLWDFSGYNTITTEKVPAKDDEKSRMRWYWESSHYRKEAGDLVLDKMFANEKNPSDFGVLLTPENIEEHIVLTNMARQNYLQSHMVNVKKAQEKGSQSPHIK